MGPVANHEPACRTVLGDPPVKVECLPFAQIPHSTRLFTDYLSGSPKVQQFYSRSPNFSEWLKQETPAARYDAARRQRVSDVLERQNKTWDAAPRTLANIARLRAGASTVVTGQQVALFGGPFFSILKALTALKLAEEATAAGVDAVPVFWLATTDHDLAEVNHTILPGPEGSLQPLAISSRGSEDAKAAFTPAQVGIQRDVYLYDTQGRTARRFAASETFSFDLAPNTTAYFVLAPVSSAGVALLGDDSKFVPDGRKRIPSIVEERNRLTVTVTFAPQEKTVRLFGYAMRRPAITARTGSSGEVTFDEQTGRFEVSVSASRERMNERPGSDPVQQAIVSIQGR